MMESEARQTLMHFLSFRPHMTYPVLRQFADLPGAIAHFDGEKNNFVYVPGSRSDRVVLIAHADTVWDEYYLKQLSPFDDPGLDEILDHTAHAPETDGEFIYQKGTPDWGLGADDRAGCAMLWLLRNSGHSLLVTDGEEAGQIGARHLMDAYPALAEELNRHRHMLQLDRRGGTDYKTYNLPVTAEFCRFIEAQTGYADAGKTSRTDIITLCRKVCGANLSVGYYNEHTPQEVLCYPEWLHTLETVSRMLEGEQPQFPLQTAE